MWRLGFVQAKWTPMVPGSHHNAVCASWWAFSAALHFAERLARPDPVTSVGRDGLRTTLESDKSRSETGTAKKY